ncbi:hypothetical protein [Marinobacter sp. DY40_1A1]|uniref:hypothetical protein n=1 Tax=Marinobacter sp. DY40_1A1 TaxID=2583229 RepID=UPI00190428C1|nr:hypothetical protein [Marinobacter sp. DY40_1A1]MBK1885628.1 hypothetical protein [Marinobacter sp. DY40_1A1]
MSNKFNSLDALYLRLSNYQKKGGKSGRAEEVRKVKLFIKYCGCPPAQIGKRHVKTFFNEKNYSPSYTRDYYYALGFLWEQLGRSSKPPKPPIIKDLYKNKGE